MGHLPPLNPQVNLPPIPWVKTLHFPVSHRTTKDTSLQPRPGTNCATNAHLLQHAPPDGATALHREFHAQVVLVTNAVQTRERVITPGQK